MDRKLQAPNNHCKKDLKTVKAKKLDCKIKIIGVLTVLQTGEKIKPFVIFDGERTAWTKHYNEMKNEQNKYLQIIFFCTCSPKGGMNSILMTK